MCSRVYYNDQVIFLQVNIGVDTTPRGVRLMHADAEKVSKSKAGLTRPHHGTAEGSSAYNPASHVICVQKTKPRMANDKESTTTEINITSNYVSRTSGGPSSNSEVDSSSTSEVDSSSTSEVDPSSNSETEVDSKLLGLPVVLLEMPYSPLSLSAVVEVDLKDVPHWLLRIRRWIRRKRILNKTCSQHHKTCSRLKTCSKPHKTSCTIRPAPISLRTKPAPAQHHETTSHT